MLSVYYSNHKNELLVFKHPYYIDSLGNEFHYRDDRTYLTFSRLILIGIL